jgi:hypothetical protein
MIQLSNTLKYFCVRCACARSASFTYSEYKVIAHCENKSVAHLLFFFFFASNGKKKKRRDGSCADDEPGLAGSQLDARAALDVPQLLAHRLRLGHF